MSDMSDTRRWYNDQHELHREDGPAVDSNSYKAWYINGQRHRTDGPAVTSASILSTEWWEEGMLHRVNGPAIIVGDYQAWYLNGRRHREDGPAVVGGPGIPTYHIHGVTVTKEEMQMYAFCKTKGVVE